MSPRTILITGANRGIGFAILQALAERSPSDHYLLGSRTKANGIEAIAKLRELGVKSTVDVLELDVSSDESIQAAVEEVQSKYHKLDVLINNAGIAKIPAADHSDIREVYNACYNINVASVAVVMSLFLPLLRESPDARIINISSGRGSISLSLSEGYSPTVAIPYNATKTALNAVTVEYWKTPGNENVKFHIVGPGHCKTGLDGFRGPKDPLDGAKVVVHLTFAERDKFPNGFWRMEGDDKEPTQIPW
jgi:NAD(P)-dependent dehydrogenase (short-subunit alcohol dehydrogenase family)